MDWRTALWHLLEVLGGVGLASFLLRRWIVIRLEQSIKYEFSKRLTEYTTQLQHQLNKDLEEHKASLQEQVNRAVQETQAGFQEAVEQRAVDRVLYQSFRRAFPSALVVNIGDLLLTTFSVQMNDIEALDTFTLNWTLPEYEFLDQELEAKRLHLLECTRRANAYMANQMLYDDHGISRLPSASELGVEKREAICQRIAEFWRAVDEAHQDLVRTARAKLKC